MKLIFRKLCPAFAAFLFIVCFSQVALAQNEPTTINWIPTSNKVLGLGVDVNNIDKWNPAAFTFKADTFKMGVSGETKLQVVETEEQLAEALGFEAGIAARNLNFNVEAKFGMNKESINNSFNLTLVLTAKEYYDLIMLNPNSIQLTKRAETAILKNFQQTYGSYYIGAVRTGSMIALIISIKTKSSEVKQSLSASLSGSYKSGFFNASGYANFKSALKSSKDNLNIDIDVKYWGIQSNDSIRTLIENFKDEKSNDRFDLEKLMRSSASLLSSMNRNYAAPLILSLSSFNTLDSRINTDIINVNDDLINYKLLRIQKEYFEVKEKLSQVFELLSMNDINSQKFFYKDTTKKDSANKEDNVATKRAADLTRSPKYVFDSLKYNQYLNYTNQLNAMLHDLAKKHSECIKCKDAECCKDTIYNLDKFYIPPKYSPFIFRRQVEPEQVVTLAYSNVIFQTFELHNLKINVPILIKYRFHGTPNRNCEPSGRTYFGFTSKNECTSGCTIPFQFLSNPFDQIGTIEVKANPDGDLIFYFSNYADYCGGNATLINLDDASYIEVQYKED